MQLSTLAMKQKRAIDWETFLNNGGVKNPDLHTKIASALKDFREHLVAAWRAGEVSPEHEEAIGNSERILESLTEEARTKVDGFTPTKKEATFSQQHQKKAICSH